MRLCSHPRTCWLVVLDVFVVDLELDLKKNAWLIVFSFLVVCEWILSETVVARFTSWFCFFLNLSLVARPVFVVFGCV